MGSTIASKMKEIPDWLKKTSKVLQEESAAKAQTEQSARDMLASDKKLTEERKIAAVSKLESQVNLSLLWWKNLEIDQLLEDVSKHVFSNCECANISVDCVGLEGNLSLNKDSIFTMNGWTGTTGRNRVLSSPNLRELLLDFAPPDTRPEVSNLRMITQAVFTSWSTSHFDGETREWDVYPHYKDLFTVKMQGGAIWFSTDDNHGRDGDKKYTKALTVLSDTTSEDLKKVTDDFLSKIAKA